MKLYMKLTITTLLLAGVLLSSVAFWVQSEPAQAQQLQGEAAREFLAREGILDQLTTGLATISPQGRNFEEPIPVATTDVTTGDNFGWSVAADGNTILVGAWGTDVEGSSQQGAAYVFTRSGTTWSQQQKLLPDDGAADDEFGRVVAVDGDTAVVGAAYADVDGNADQGATYVFTRSDTTWSQQQKLVADDGIAGDEFGHVVAVDGDTVVVGAHLADVGSNGAQGAAYVFTRSDTAWSQQQKLVADDGAAGDRFGYAVAVASDTAVVGARLANVGSNGNQGAAYVFTRSDTAWSQQQKLVADDGVASDYFGLAVAADGDTVVVGAGGADIEGTAGQGAAYVFTRSDTTWSQQQKLVADDGAAYDNFGSAVSIEGDTAIMGVAAADVGGNDNQGAAYVFTRSDTTWSQQQKLVAGDGAAIDQLGRAVALAGDTVVMGAYHAAVDGMIGAGKIYVAERGPVPWPMTSNNTADDGAALDLFGWAVAMDGNTAVVGAAYAGVGDNDNQGAAYVFTRSDTTWSQQQKLLADDGAASDNFGYSVAVDGDTVVVGALYANVGNNDNQGAAYVFTRSDTTWSQQQKLVADDGAASDRFGQAVAVEGDTAVVGATYATVDGNDNQGAAYIFTRSDTTWSQQQKLVADDGAAGDHFGQTAAMDGDTAVVGAYTADVGGNNVQGAAYVFTRSDTTWSQQQKLVADDGAASDHFGQTAAVDGDTVVVGAYTANVGDNDNQGAAYVFTRSDTTWSQQQKLVAGDGASQANFGRSVAIDGDTTVMGADQANVGGNNVQGAAYVFTRSDTTWSQQQKLLAGDGAPFEHFGFSVAVDGDTAVVGVPWANADGNNDQGAAYFYKRERLAQTIDFPAPPSGTNGYFVRETVPLSATADSGLPVSYRSDTLDVCTVSANTATLLAAGQCSITAFQPGNATYTPAEATQSFTVILRKVYLPLIVH